MSHGKPVDVLITGANGQLGAALTRHLHEHDGATFQALTREQFDIDNVKHLDRIVEQVSPRIVVNCAADTRVARADLVPSQSWAANTRAVGYLARWCARIGATLIHLSTDFVFGRDGNHDHPYDEDDPVGPIGNYAVSKLAGEYEVLRRNEDTVGGLPYYIIRTAGLFCMPRPQPTRNFPSAIVKKLADPSHEAIKVVNDVHTNITRAEDLARAIAYFIIQPQVIPYGIYHVTNPGEATWFDVAARIITKLGHGVECLQPISRSEYRSLRDVDGPLAPAYTVLDIGKYISVGGPELPHWTKAIDEWCACYKGEAK
jgi:dTDP-4-dehydrorhamnose reductase